MRNTFLFILSISFLYACKSKDETTPNRPPNVFTVTPTLKPDGKTIVLNWSKAKDPDGDAVTYVVVLKDTLVKNLSDTTFILSNLDFNYSQTGKVIAKDTKGLTTEASFTATTKTKTLVNIPDAIFEKYLVDMKIDSDGLVNGKMDINDAKGVKVINLNYMSSITGSNNIGSIKTLAGIEVFTDLEELYCGSNCDYGGSIPCSFGYHHQLTSLDVSKNIALKILDCSINQLTSLDVSKNMSLQNLDCRGNQLTSLDVSKNIALQYLNCRFNQMTNLDISKNLALQQLDCSGNPFNILDISKNLALQGLYCNYNQLTNLDISKNIALQYLDCRNNQLTSLDISKNIALNQLYCSANQIKTICVADKAKAEANKSWQKDTLAAYAVCQ